jgi:hypothetical protein
MIGSTCFALGSVPGYASLVGGEVVSATYFLGSICFMVSSWLAIVVVCHRIWCVEPHEHDWWIAAINLLGSIFFMASAFAAFVVPTTGNLLDASLANTGTLLGAICFFWAARIDIGRLEAHAEMAQ